MEQEQAGGAHDKSKNLVPTVVASVVASALLFSGGVYAFQKVQNDKQVANLQNQINILSGKLAVTQATPVPQVVASASAAPSPTNTPAIEQSAATVSDFYATYEALSNDIQNMTLKHKLVIDMFTVPANSKDANMQSLLYSGKSLDGTLGGPELFGSAAGASHLLSYKIISHTVSSKTGTDQEATYRIDETVFNGSQGNTKQDIRHQILQLVRPDPSSSYLISSYISSDPGASQGSFYGFIE